MAVWALALAARPADAEHVYGHSKAEYIASAVEGILILVATFSIGWAAIDRLFHRVSKRNERATIVNESYTHWAQDA